MASYTKALAAIARLRKLPNGWDYGHGSSASQRAVDSSLGLIELLSGFGIDDFDIAPGTDGGVTVFAYRGTDSVEIQAFPNGTYDFLLEENDISGDVFEGLDLKDIVQKLEDAGWRSPRLYVSCTRAVTWHGNVVLPDLHLAIHPGMVAFPLSAPTALPGAEWISAPTFVSSTTKEYVANRRSSGEFRELPSRKECA
jgi:hypothetical protein